MYGAGMTQDGSLSCRRHPGAIPLDDIESEVQNKRKQMHNPPQVGIDPKFDRSISLRNSSGIPEAQFSSRN
jgi:hypothetical protein